MIKRLLILTLILTIKLSAQKTLLVLPYCTNEISEGDASRLFYATQHFIFTSGEYVQAISNEAEKRIYERTKFDKCDFYLDGEQSANFIRIISNLNIDEVLSCAANYENGEYGLFFKLKNAKTGEVIKSSAYGLENEMSDILSKQLDPILTDFFKIPDKRTKYISLAGAYGYLDNYSDYTAGARLGFGSVNIGEFSVEANLYTKELGQNFAFTYRTPLKYWVFLKFGVAFTSEDNENFRLNKYHNAPKASTIKEFSHSAGALAALGLSIPLGNYFRINISAESDFTFAEWKKLDGIEEKSIIYSYYPEIEISYQFKF